MEQILTDRLILEPAGLEETIKLAENCKASDPELSEAYLEMADGCRNNPEMHLWYAPWKILLKSSRVMIGDACFKGLSENKNPEIGYGTYEKYRCKGYTTEAVHAMCKWAFSHSEVTAVEAEADPKNAASIRVLTKVGFRPTGEFGEEGQRYILTEI